MKRVIIIMVILFLMAIPIYADHVYYNGKVTKISKNLLTVDKDVYWVASNCRVAIHYKKNGAFYEKPASFSDVRVGEWVTIKVEGKTIKEILIEQYRK